MRRLLAHRRSAREAGADCGTNGHSYQNSPIEIGRTSVNLARVGAIRSPYDARHALTTAGHLTAALMQLVVEGRVNQNL